MKKGLLLSILMAVLSFTAYAQLTTSNAQRYYAEFKNYFNDDICTELATPYSAMTDDELRTAMSAMPTELIEIALKVKNDTWEKREKEFRVFKAKPYSNSYNWKYLLNVRQYSELQNPTGITADNEYLLIFVGSELPDSIWLELSPVAGNMTRPLMTNVLTSGLNMVKIPDTEGDDRMLFIQYYVDTDSSATSKKLADYPNVPIHIEGGYVNGYFDLARHTDEDWRDMTQNYMKHYSVQVLGEKVMYHMELNNILKACPNTITDAIKWWDRCVKWQHELMGADKYYDRWNDLILAKDGYEGMYMYATETYTYYEHYTLPDILPWSTVSANTGQMWGPAHEIGHVNQGAINIVSCTESSNNLFSNVQIHRAGKTTTRGLGVADCVSDFNNNIPFPLRDDAIGKSRMYFQLYLYFHAAGKDKTFYPRLFEALRKDRLEEGERDRNWVAQTMAIDNQLKFAEKCCEIAQMDLSEFFEAWGFFEPMKDAWVGDYTNFNVNLTKEEADASRARMQQYSRKGGHLMFIEDRIKPSKREDGVPGNRLDFSDEFPIGKMGETGQWGDYIDESVKAKGYYHLRRSSTVEIVTDENASGALGFKIYDAETGKLLTFGNTHTLSIPTAAMNSTFRVVAAQADGTDYEIPSAEISDDQEMQRLALDAKISSIMYMVLRTTTTGNEIGRYYSNEIAPLRKLYNDAKNVVSKKDTSLHSYKEWISLIDKEVERVRKTTNARAYLQDLDVYNISNTANKEYYLCNDNMGLKANTNSEQASTSLEKCWLVESTGEAHHYYIKNKNGKYINDLSYSVGAMCSGESQDDAIVFKANYHDKGAVYFTTKKDGMYITLNGDNKIVGGYNLVDAAVWYVTRIEQNNTAIDEIESNSGDDENIYDLQGRKVTNPGKGIFIKNGKLIIK